MCAVTFNLSCQQVLREVKVLAHLNHSNVVGYHAAWLEYVTTDNVNSALPSKWHPLHLTVLKKKTGLSFLEFKNKANSLSSSWMLIQYTCDYYFDTWAGVSFNVHVNSLLPGSYSKRLSKYNLLHLFKEEKIAWLGKIFTFPKKEDNKRLPSLLRNGSPQQPHEPGHF